MADPNLSQLRESVDYSLHRMTHILKGAVCVSTNVELIDETIDTLVRLALEEVEGAEQSFKDLRKHQYALGKKATA